MTMREAQFKTGCPKCGHPQTCPCEHCAKNNVGKMNWIWKDGDTISCAKCGFTASADYWEDLDMQRYAKRDKETDHALDPNR
jgi:predicted RNA-binding Zn-ribbon protein involved in translation (DUF1610 family)